MDYVSAFLFCFAHDEADGGGQPVPALELARQLLPSGRGERVELRLAAGVGQAGLRLEPSLLLEAMERRIERTLGDLQDVRLIC